jgi:hypothetical protein
LFKINMLMPVKQNSITHLRVLLALTDRGIVVLTRVLFAAAVSMQILQRLRELELRVPLRGQGPMAEGGGACYQLTYLDPTMLVGRASGSGGSFIFERAVQDPLPE